MLYDDSWRERRRLFTKYFHPNNPSNASQQLEFIHKMLVRLLDNPDDFLDINRRYTFTCLRTSQSTYLP